ncbi:T9SS type A sorting domain-containing protein [Phaeocystidibacter marisrubri]|uniref:T9SS type A sorting domain-containing protein n=2 Tax=Phaeocystidibacter marisrubri TaxID=1577780 RepID=A0A6L3ZFR0_9FLAO|nr:T9SS type A sorting domain-containing protein [Phaeocystidibacter marisrubri]KAB2816247.1 T9SS type A sorting domain-containing protein [Phaeocystidibacter marisrubri]
MSIFTLFIRLWTHSVYFPKRGRFHFWESLPCEAEDELLKGEIDQTMFAVQQGNCQMLLENGMKMMSQEYSPKSSLIESMAGQLLVKSLFPNPTTGRVVLEFTEEIDHVTFQLHDLNGKVIKSGEWSNLRSTSVDLSKLDPGIYLLSIISDGKSETQQIVLAK